MALVQPHDWFSIIVTIIGLLCCLSKHGWKEVPLTLPYMSIKDDNYYSCVTILFDTYSVVLLGPLIVNSLSKACAA